MRATRITNVGKATVLCFLSVRGFCHDLLGRHRYFQDNPRCLG